MRTLALLLVAIWSTHLPLCVLAEGHDAAPRAATESAAAEHAAHHHHGDASEAPSPASSRGHDESCVEHCAKLIQGVPQYAPALAAPPVVAIVVAPPAPESGLTARAERFASHAFDRGPPDPGRLTTVLRL